MRSYSQRTGACMWGTVIKQAPVGGTRKDYEGSCSENGRSLFVSLYILCTLMAPTLREDVSGLKDWGPG